MKHESLEDRMNLASMANSTVYKILSGAGVGFGAAMAGYALAGNTMFYITSGLAFIASGFLYATGRVEKDIELRKEEE